MAKTTWTCTTAYVARDDEIYCALSADIYEAFARFTSLNRWSPQLYDGVPGSEWRYKNVNWNVTAVHALIPEEGDKWWLCALSEEGDILYTGGGEGLPPEKIPGAGVFSEGATGWGYLADLRQIGEYLYACGYKGQVYKRFAPNDWRHVDQGLLQNPETPLDNRIALSVINGPHECAIYAAGYQHTEWLPPKAFFFNGRQWTELTLPDVAARITNIYVESESSIWMCGANGTLLRGNAHEGFQNLSSVEDSQLFTSVCKFQEKIYLASNLGLFVYDPQQHSLGVQPVITDLKPDLQDANIVDSYEGVMWSIGLKDIARFNGQHWQRLHLPDNPPIGED